MDFCKDFSNRRLITRCSTKRNAHCSFRRVLSNRYFRKVLLVHVASTWNNLLNHSNSDEFLLVEGYVQALYEGVIAPFVEDFKTTTLGKFP